MAKKSVNGLARPNGTDMRDGPGNLIPVKLLSPIPPPPSNPTQAQIRSAVRPGPSKTSAFDPYVAKLSYYIQNPIFTAIHGKWSDRQQHGRIAYDAMMAHGAVSGPCGALKAYLQSYKPMFKSRQSSPTERQKMLADFANAQLDRLGASGDPRQGWGKVVEWFYQGLRYGFSLAEMETVEEPWNGKPKVQINRIVPFPQASLDLGFIPKEEFGESVVALVDPRYRCFIMDPNGRITRVVQYWRGVNAYGKLNTELQIVWEGKEMLRLLHFVHGGGEGNPFGESILFSAYRHWASLYTIELMEDAFLDTSLPYLAISYKTPDGRPSPEIHNQFLSAVTDQDPTKRVLALPDTTYTSVAPSNPNFTDHVEKKIHRLERHITQAIGVPMTLYAEGTGKEANTRELVSVFFTNYLPSILSEISELMTWQFAKRLIDANWTNVQDEDYPIMTFRMVQNEDLRIAMPLLQQILNLVDSDKVGEFLQAYIPGFDRDYIPDSHKQSVAAKRQPTDPAASAKGQPPQKEVGTRDTVRTGKSSNPSNKKTVA